MLHADSPLRSNPVFWLIWVLLGSAVVGGLATLAVALRHADHRLPASYHWEGEHLDQDFARARFAATHGIEVSFAAAAGQCTAAVRHAPGDPRALTLTFASAADPGLDRVLRLERREAGTYAAACTAPPPGRWRVSLQDDAGQWSIRTQLDGDGTQFEMRARDPDGNGEGAP